MVTLSEKRNKRKFPRRNFNRAIGFLYRGDYFVGQGVEIGEGGLAFLLEKKLPLEAEGVVSLQIPGGSFICIRVVIKNVSNEGTGITLGCSFIDLQFDHKREVRSYVSARRA